MNPISNVCRQPDDAAVLRTGLIAPFYTGGGDKSRLKKASYEGRIGKKAYVFDEIDKITHVLDPGKPLEIPANSIVFIESDIEFRLPQYIGFRYNLQIRHVHRGLLLGTGPLVDPGYWGKLCIPLHNLTNEPYHIPLEEGLVWFEFTKTTSDSKIGRKALQSGAKDDGYWDIEYFLRKAAKSLVEGQADVGIRSSIPLMALETKERAEKAELASNNSATSAKEAEANAKEAKDALKYIQNIGLFGAIILFITIVTLWTTIYVGVRGDINSLQGLVQSNAIGENAISSFLFERVGELERRLERSEDETRPCGRI